MLSTLASTLFVTVTLVYCHKTMIFLGLVAGTTGLEPATSAVTVMLSGCKQMISWALMANYSTLDLGGHPNPAIEGQLKTGHRETV